jgi:hypothetical protein
VKQEVNSTVILPPLVFPGGSDSHSVANGEWNPSSLNLVTFAMLNHETSHRISQFFLQNFIYSGVVLDPDPDPVIKRFPPRYTKSCDHFGTKIFHVVLLKRIENEYS